MKGLRLQYTNILKAWTYIIQIHEGCAHKIYRHLKGMRIQHLYMWKLCICSIEVYKRLAHTICIYIRKAWACNTDIWKSFSYSVENMKGLRIKYTSMLNMRAYYIPAHKKLLHTIGIYMKSLHMRHTGMWKMCAYNISIFSKASDRLSPVIELQHCFKFGSGPRDTTPWSECCCHRMVLFTL